MKQEMYQEVEIPEGVEVELPSSGSGEITVKGPEGEITKNFDVPRIEIKKQESKISVGSEKATKTEKKMINTIRTRIRNMIDGVKEKYTYKLKICSSHFPMTAEVKGNEFTLSNFFGEKIPRKMQIPAEAEVEVSGEEITVTSYDKEIAGQTAADLERLTSLKSKDRRVFQDGIFITSKPEKITKK